MSTFVSSGAFRTRSVSAVIDDALSLGVSHIELSSGLEHDPDLDANISRGLNAGLTFLIHNYFPAPAEPRVLNLAAPDEDDLAWSIAHCKRALDLAVFVKCPFYSLHAGYAVPLTADLLGRPEAQATAMREYAIDRQAAYGRMLEAVQDIADYARERDKRLLIENNVISPLYLEKVPENPLLMTDATEIERFMADVDRTNVGFLIDVGHARVSASALKFDALEFMARTKPYTEALHLSDNDSLEDQNLPFDKTSWFWPLLDGYGNVPKVIEAYALASDEILELQEVLRSSNTQYRT